VAPVGEKTGKPSKSRSPGFPTVLNEFARDTNIEGVNNAGRAPSNIRKVIWLLIFTFLAVLTVQDLVSLTKEFLTWPVDVSTTIDHEDSIPFPSVTVCNQNRVSCRRLKEFLKRCQTGTSECKNKAILEQLVEEGNCNNSQLPIKVEETSASTQTSLSGMKKPGARIQSKMEKSSLESKLKSTNQGAQFGVEQKFLSLYSSLTVEERFHIGHAKEDLVKSCTFRGFDCMGMDEDSFDHEVVLNPVYGNCYNFYLVDPSIGQSSMSGVSYGLSLELNIEPSDYLKGGQTTAMGARVSVQERNAYPLVDEYGIDLAPGQLTSISIQLVNITRHPYSGCGEGKEWSEAEYSKEEDSHTSYSYSMTLCQRLCVQQVIEAECNCSHPLLTTLGDEDSDSDLKRPCKLTKEQGDMMSQHDSTCVLKATLDFDVGDNTCKSCGPACREEDYEKLVSSTKLYGDKMEETARVEIYFMSLNVKTITETARYTTTKFISELGGALGAWMGFSCCMIFEVVELAFDLGLSCFGR